VADENRIYFKQLLTGVQLAKSDQSAAQMANFIYLLSDKQTRECVVVDPAWDIEGILKIIEDDGMKLTGALVTHYHQDHVGGQIMGFDIEGVGRLLERHPVPIYVNEHEGDGMRTVTGASESDLVRKSGGDSLSLGEVRIRLLHTPGHTPGSQCFLIEEHGHPGRLVSGDTLFLCSCGRVDLPGSDPAAMHESLNGTLKALPDETILYPGHMYTAEASGSLGEQKQMNPFLRVANLDQFLQFMGG